MSVFTVLAIQCNASNKGCVKKGHGTGHIHLLEKTTQVYY